MSKTNLTLAVSLTVLFSLALGACSGGVTKIPRNKRVGEIGKQYEGEGNTSTIFGEDGISFGNDKNTSPDQGGGGGIGVNTYLWRASLDTIAFMPVTSADPFGGVIITDWYSPSETPMERFKLNVYILGRALRADGVRVSVFRQVYDNAGIWRDAQVQKDAGRKLEDAVLTRARQLRNETRMQQ